MFYIQAVLRDVRNAGIGLLQGLGFMQEASQPQRDLCVRNRVEG